MMPRLLWDDPTFATQPQFVEDQPTTIASNTQVAVLMRERRLDFMLQDNNPFAQNGRFQRVFYSTVTLLARLRG